MRKIICNKLTTTKSCNNLKLLSKIVKASQSLSDLCYLINSVHMTVLQAQIQTGKHNLLKMITWKEKVFALKK